MEKELKNIFIKQYTKGLQTISQSLKKLKKNKKDKKSLSSLRIVVHSLEGDALHAKQYLLAYFASKMNELLTLTIHKKSIDAYTLEFLNDFSQSLNLAFTKFQSPKKINKAALTLLNKLEKIIAKEYANRGRYE